MKRRLSVVVILLALAVLVVACGSAETATTSDESMATNQSATTLSQAAASTTDTTAATTSTTLSQLEAYGQEMREWFEKYEEELETKSEALGDIDAPLSASDQAIQAVEDFADLMNDVVDDLEDIKPPADLSSAHSDYVAALEDMASGLSQFAQALRDKSLSAVIDASTVLEAATEKGTPARDALEEALSFSLSGEEDEPADGELGTRENPVPLGQEAQVGSWKVKVLEATLDADEIVYNHSEFNERPQAGNQYLMIRLEATRTGEEAAAFWVDTYYEFVGSGGNTFDVGYADIPDAISDTNEAYPGASISGNLVFDVSSDQVAGGTLRLSEAFSLDDVEVFFAVD